MRILIGLTLAFGAVGCGGQPGEPAWALDPIYLEPADASSVYGLQSWDLFDEDWQTSRARRDYVCGVVVELEGTPASSPCEDCVQAWDVTASFVESDCDDELASDPRFLSLRAVGLTEEPPELEGNEPHPGQSMGVVADYGDGWEPYGWGFPEVLDHGEEPDDTSWDDEQPFTLWPAFAWDLGG